MERKSLRQPFASNNILSEIAPIGVYLRLGTYVSESTSRVGAYSRGLNQRRGLIESLRHSISRMRQSYFTSD